jgi:predicted CXXCH cytochrome family protein
MKKQISPTTIIRCFAAVLSVFLFHSFGTAATLDTTKERGKCDFSLQLQQDPTLRDAYINAISRANDISFSRSGDVESMYRNVIPVRNSAGDVVGIDSFSHECISCHDGMNATYHSARFQSSGGSRTLGLEDVVGSHPIGMTYEYYVGKPYEYRGPEGLSRDMVFVDGRIGCLTCHNPLESGKYHLVATNDGSAICMSCHVR